MTTVADIASMLGVKQSEVITSAQMKTFLGGEFPYHEGYDWNKARFWIKNQGEENLYNPHSGSEYIPGPTLELSVVVV